MGTALSVVVDLSNRVTVAFQTPTSPFRLGTNSFTNEVTSPTFRGITGSGLAQFNANGALLWMKRAPFNVDGNSSSVGLTLVGDRANNLYLRALANLMTNRFALGVPGLSVLKMEWWGGALWTNEVKNTPFGINVGDGQGADQRGLPGISIAPNGRLAVIGSVYGDRTTLGYIGWTNVLAFTNGTGHNLLSYSIESNYVGVLPQFITQPTNMVFQPPTALTNYALARAWPVADYRWYMVTNGVGGRVGTNQFFTLQPTTVANVTTYYVVASNLLGQTTGTVVFAQPLLAIFPVANSTNAILLGGSGTLSINATGTTAITYQWRFNGTNIAGATSSALVLNNVATNANGLYTVVACNAWGCVTSAPPITVKVVPPGTIDGTYVTQLTGDAAMVRLSDGRLKDICSVCGARMFSAEPQDVDADSLDSDLKKFHHYGIQNHAESYLVCLYDVEKTGGPKNEAEIKATVVDRIKGEKRFGEEFVFRRVSESSFEQLLRMRGGLYYVFLKKEDDGKMAVDGQDPAALRKYSDELGELVQRHKQRAIVSGIHKSQK